MCWTRKDASTEAEINETGAECLFVHLDVTSEDDWRSAVAAAVSRFGKVDILVNNAGISTRGGIEDITEAQWERTMDINVKGVFLGTREVIPAMRDAGGGSIINISSGAGIAPAPGYLGSLRRQQRAPSACSPSPPPSSTHGRASGVTRCTPGPVQTPMLGETPEDAERVAAQVGRVPLGRVGQPIEIAYGVLYLASDESSFVTGSEVVIDGGRTAQ